MNRFLARWAGMFVRPRRTIENIAVSPDWGEGLAATSVFGGAYSLASLTAYLTGHRPLGPTPRFIPRERYYLWESLFLVPLTLLWMGLFAGLTRQSAKRLGGSGTTKADFEVLAFAQSMPMIAGFAVPDLLCYLLRLDLISQDIGDTQAASLSSSRRRGVSP